MVCFVTAGFADDSSLSATEILGAGKFVAAVINHVVAGYPGRDVGAQLLNLYLHNDRDKDQKSFQKIGRDHHAQGNQSERGLTRQTAFRAR